MFNNNTLFDLLQQANDDWDDDLAHLMDLDDEITATEFYFSAEERRLFMTLFLWKRREGDICASLLLPLWILTMLLSWQSSGVEVIRLL